ncbi:MAG: ATP-dependent zinc metalloprotease FtsH [Lachnospiraceae bacterium]|nr:ATP-dependent zinc metalloprotease FtsH [Lachnospiraceae bacterium]
MKSMLACLVVALLLTGMVGLVAQKYRTGEVQEIKYSEFLKMLEDGKIESVTLSSSKVTVTPKDQTNAKSKVTYYAVLAPDYDIVDRLHKAGVTFEEVQESNWSQILWYIVPFILFWGFLIFMTRNISKGGGIMGVGKSNAKLYVEDKTGVTFADVAGQDEAKESLTEMVDFLHNPDKYTQIGAKLPKGALLVGPPGTGKTLLAKAVAGEAGVPFFSLSGSSFVEMYVGVGASRVRDLFKEAQKMAPCIIFIDEIDAIGKSRASDRSGGGNDEREQTLNQLLAEMDGFDSSKGLVILAATNRPEVLDKALLRPGRFDRRVIVEKPDLKGRIDTLKVHSKDVHMDETVDFNEIALATSGAVGSDLANMVNEAALNAVKHGRSLVSQADMLEAVELVIAGKEKKDRILGEREKSIVAHHEVGHALIMALQKDSEPVQKITIVPRTMGSLGYVMQFPEEEKYLETQAEMEAELVSLLGGRAAEEVKFDTVTTGASNDIEKATQLARSMVTQYGMSKAFGLVNLESVESRYLDGRPVLNCSDKTAAKIDKEVQNMLAAAYKKALAMIRDNENTLDAIAEYLIEKETITGKQFMEIFHEVRDHA